MTDLEWMPEPDDRAPRKCAHPRWRREGRVCSSCGHVFDEARQREGRNSKARGGRHELLVARKYGGIKTGHHGGPVDVEGLTYATQVKTHRGLPPAWYSIAPTLNLDRQRVHVWRIEGGWQAYAPLRWDSLFTAMDANARTTRLCERYLPGQGRRPIDYMVVRAKDDPAALPYPTAYLAYSGDDWLDLYGRDE